MGKSILIVDDAASIRATVSIALKGAGYDVIEACDGNDALSKLNGVRVNLVISDVNMPGMDGITLLKRLKEGAATRFLPVIMLTTEGSDDKKMQGKEAGAKAWIVKPFDPAKLLDAVSKLIQP
ncbi:DNA-binding response regulator, OmpR family, contains REC and winged-helix (wHTH) domain [Chromobacterium violaceum]|uniref:Phosphate regulon transcriptional regulatory protein phoB n=2 Tax=Chromobacterium violaceum TaxID=536 RepID=A0A202B788_CHRVL|nr:response regulator [Chromobacterium violaceum]AAQ60183.1 chemotaxis protein CheY [Chromobacterium violaceum ATCC 12472]ATP28958.1 response regulator [Chromobacterium violaceum]ATP32869.1 response regulator [Chromobacterium violaceum]KJH67853.1 chemotaxis protein CheY [Chromobacterium violaceum]KMN49256.1 chemotaxis protein CheY [Chromobacterium violaceum]